MISPMRTYCPSCEKENKEKNRLGKLKNIVEKAKPTVDASIAMEEAIDKFIRERGKKSVDSKCSTEK